MLYAGEPAASLSLHCREHDEGLPGTHSPMEWSPGRRDLTKDGVHAHRICVHVGLQTGGHLVTHPVAVARGDARADDSRRRRYRDVAADPKRAARPLSALARGQAPLRLGRIRPRRCVLPPRPVPQRHPGRLRRGARDPGPGAAGPAVLPLPGHELRRPDPAGRGRSAHLPQDVAGHPAPPAGATALDLCRRGRHPDHESLARPQPGRGLRPAEGEGACRASGPAPRERPRLDGRAPAPSRPAAPAAVRRP